MEGLWPSPTWVGSTLFRGVVLSCQPNVPTPLPLDPLLIALCPLHFPHPWAAINLPGHEPSGPGHCARLSAPAAVGECQCQTCGSIECAHGCPGRACWWGRGTRPLASWGHSGMASSALSREKQEEGGGGSMCSTPPYVGPGICHGRMRDRNKLIQREST